jgi:hypothetical protein
MMLSSSALAFNHEVDIASIGDPSVPTGIPGGTELLALVDTVMGVSSTDLTDIHRTVVAVLGPEALADAASVHGNFEMMNRVAEGTGIPIAPQAIASMQPIIDDLGIRDFLKS